MAVTKQPDTAFETGIYMKYLGVLSLLGQVTSGHAGRNLSTDQRYLVERAMEDANRVLATKKAGVRFSKTAGGGWAAFDHKEDDK